MPFTGCVRNAEIHDPGRDHTLVLNSPAASEQSNSMISYTRCLPVSARSVHPHLKQICPTVGSDEIHHSEGQ